MNRHSNLNFPTETQTMTLYKLSRIIHSMDGKNNLYRRKAGVEVNQSSKLLNYLLLH